MKKPSFIVLSSLAISFGFLAAPLRGEFVYVANGADNTVSAYSIDDKTGALTSVPGSPFATGIGPASVAVDPRVAFAYVANADSNTVSAYSIDRKTGALTPIQGSPFATGRIPVSIAITRH